MDTILEILNGSFDILEEISEYIRPFLEIAGTVLLVLGALFCYAGYNLFKVLLVLTGALVGALIGGLLTFGNPIGFLLGALIGAFLNYILYFVGVFLMGMLLAVIAVFLFSFLVQIPESFYLVAAIVGGIFALVYEKIIMVISTSFNGAFLMAIGGYLLFVSPDLLLIINGARMIPLWILILGLTGIVVQLNLFSKTKRLNLNSNVQGPQKPAYYPPEKPTERVPASGNLIIPLSICQESGNNIHCVYTVNWRPVAGGFEALVGKNSSAGRVDVEIPESVISRRHALLKQKQNQFFIQHLSTTNPTYVNNALLQYGSDYPLNKGDKIIFGNLHFKVH